MRNTIIQPVIYISFDANLCTQGPQKLSELSRVTVTTNGSIATDELAAPYLVRGGLLCTCIWVCVWGGGYVCVISKDGYGSAKRVNLHVLVHVHVPVCVCKC